MQVSHLHKTWIALLFLLCSFNQTKAQTETFELLPDSMMLSLRYTITGDVAAVYTDNVPDWDYPYILSISNLKGNSVGYMIFEPYMEDKGMYSFDLDNQLIKDDSLLFSITAVYDGMYYPPVLITGYKTLGASIAFGSNCYVVECYPENDPWMPSAVEPFLMSTDGWYLNPDNGRIKSGKKIIRSGLYTGCDMETFIEVAPYKTYVDRNKNEISGAELIKKRKIDLDDFLDNTFQ